MSAQNNFPLNRASNQGTTVSDIRRKALERAFRNRYLPPSVPVLATQATGYGASGTKYVFNVYPLYTKFYDVGGVYAFTRQYVDRNGYVWYQPLYIGETQSLLRRVTIRHEQWGCAVNNGVNTICTFGEYYAYRRGLFERDLLLNYRTTCNKQIQ